MGTAGKGKSTLLRSIGCSLCRAKDKEEYAVSQSIDPFDLMTK